MNFRADLHCHSTFSDGTLSPQEIVVLALEKGLSGLSITDHDTIDAYTETDILNHKEIQVIPGVEFTTSHRGKSVHVLAYSFSVNDPHIKALSAQHKTRREERFRAMGGLLQNEGFDIDVERILSQVKMPGRPHLAMALLEKGVVADIKEAFEKYIGDDKKCFIPSHAISTEETLAILKNAKAVPVIAHPHLIKDSKVQKDLIKMDFEGIEVYYGNFLFVQCKRWLQIAKDKKWLATGGSDFHGSIKHVALGSSFTPDEAFNALLKRYEENKLS